MKILWTGEALKCKMGEHACILRLNGGKPASGTRSCNNNIPRITIEEYGAIMAILPAKVLCSEANMIMLMCL
jgi:hypothetical protein